MTAFPKFIDINDDSMFDGVSGFRLDEINGSDAFSSAGDINGDGYGDLLIGADEISPSGVMYVLYGRASGFFSSYENDDANGAIGMTLTGVGIEADFGFAVSNAGDFNGDGVGDFAATAIGASFNGDNSGSTYIFFGQDGGFASPPSVDDLDGTNGLRIDGDVAGADSGFGVESAGDVNDDGFGDVMIFTGGSGANGGQVSVVFGTATGPASLNVGDLDGDNGFNIVGAEEEFLGQAMASAGDFNADGFGDIAVAGNDDQVYVVFGAAGGFDAEVDETALDGDDGFVFTVENGGDQLLCAPIGDFNGDGFSDLMIGASSASNLDGGAYILFGSDEAFEAVIDEGDLNGSNGFRMTFPSAEAFVGSRISEAGDFNGDGFDDVLVYSGQDGNSFLVFGTSAPQGPVFDLSAIDGDNGVIFEGTDVVASAGDVNGDGFGDIMVNTSILFGSANGSLLYSDSIVGGGGDNAIDGGHANDTLSGRGGDDSLDGGGGINELFGGQGDDVLIGSDGSNNGDGGRGFDTASYAAGQVAITVQASGGGITVAKSNGGSDALISVERITGSRYDDAFKGSTGRDNFDGGGGDDLMEGLSGADLLDGGTGDDELLGGSGNDTLLGGGGHDLVDGGWGRDSLQGGAGIDTLTGGGREDVLAGGTEADLLTGGAASDRFVFEAVADSMGGRADRITDLQNGDVIDLSAIDADAGAGGNQAFVLVDNFTGAAGELRVRVSGGETRIQADVDGDGKADLTILADGRHANFDNFVL